MKDYEKENTIENLKKINLGIEELLKKVKKCETVTDVQLACILGLPCISGMIKGQIKYLEV